MTRLSDMAGSVLERYFKLSENGTTPRIEIEAGITTFLTMSYVVVVNPSILKDAGVPVEGAIFATCLAAALGTLLMGLLANYPFALAPGMGINAYFTYTVVISMNYDWRVALGAVFLSGLVFMLLTLVRIRAMIADAIPPGMKTSVAAGIGMFIAFIGLKNAGIIVASPTTFVTMGEIFGIPTFLALAGLVVTGALYSLGVRSAFIIGILLVTAVAMVIGLVPPPDSIIRMPDWHSTFLQLDLRGAFQIGLLDVIFVFLFVDMFDTIGSLVGLGRQAGFMDAEGKLPRINRALFADSAATMGGAMLGTSTVTTYIESATGVSEGGRTGLTAVVVAVLFLVATLFSPIAGAIPAVATAPALIIVGMLMIRVVNEIQWDDATEAIPAFLTIIAMPLTFSIANGLALGFIVYPVLKLLTGRWREPNPLVYLLAALYVARYIYLGTSG